MSSAFVFPAAVSTRQTPVVLASTSTALPVRPAGLAAPFGRRTFAGAQHASLTTWNAGYAPRRFVRNVGTLRMMSAPPSNEDDVGVSDETTRQLLGMKGARTGETSKWKIRLQLMKPVTWIPLIWGVVCGAAASGHFTWTLENAAASAACMLLAGPIMAGYTQTLNDLLDAEIDAINEPYRPIPSGAISLPEVYAQIFVLLGAGVGIAAALDLWAGHGFPGSLTYTNALGAFLAYIYSAPPFKLKQNGWLGNYSLGASYIALPWWAGQCLFGEVTPEVVVLTLFYSLAGLGIAIVNDFKSVEGDRKLGLQSLPVVFGIERAAQICAGMIDFFQLGVAAYLFYQQAYVPGGILLGLIAPQMYFQQKYLLKDPVQFDVKYQASSQPFLVAGILVTALALGNMVPQ